MRKQQGFTLSELVSIMLFICILVLMGLGIWAVIHFILKFW